MRTVLLLVTMVTAVPAAAQPPVLALEQAEALALERDEGLQRATATITARSERIDGADALPDPKLRLFALNFPVDSFSASQEPMTQSLVGLRQDFPAGASRRLRGLRAQAGLREAEAGYAQTRSSLLRRVRALWVDVYELEGRLALLDERETLYRELLSTSLGRYRVGRTGQEQVVGVKVKLAILEDRRVELEGRIAARRDDLARWLGDAARAPWPQELPQRLATLPEGLAEDHPELAVLEARNEQARRDVDLARQAYKPAWALEMSYGYREAFVDFLSVGVTLDLPLFTGGRQDPELAARQAELTAARYALQDRRAALLAQERSLRSEAESRLRRIAVYREEILPRLDDVIRLTTSDWEQGRRAFADLVRARETAIESRETLLGLRAALARDVVELIYLAEEVQR